MNDKANTPDEIVDIVDENDNIIGKATKGEVNSNPSLIHREIGIIIFDNKGRVLTQQRSKNKKNDPLAWTISVAGHVPSGMTYEEAAHMELMEELGFDTKLVVYEKETYHTTSETQIITSFMGQLPRDVEVKINTAEIESYRFINSSDLEDLNKTHRVESGSLVDFRKFFSGSFDEIKLKASSLV